MKSLLTLLTLVMLFIPSPLPVAARKAAQTNLATKPSCCLEVPPAKPLSDNSLYQLDSTWTNDLGQAVKLTAFQGRPQIITMFFSTCAFACPILVNDMKRIEAALPDNVRKKVGFVLISFDTERDSPAALAAYRLRHGLAENWTLLRGGPDDILEIAALLGIKFKKDARGDFAHSNVISLLDDKGEIVLQQVGLNRDPNPVRSVVDKLLKTGASCDGSAAANSRSEQSRP